MPPVALQRVLMLQQRPQQGRQWHSLGLGCWQCQTKLVMTLP